MQSPLERLKASIHSKGRPERFPWRQLLVLYGQRRFLYRQWGVLYRFLRLFRTFYGHSATPHVLRLEAASKCQLQCPGCATGDGQNKEGAIGWGLLSFENFKKFVDDNPRVREIELSNYGEIFLNPDLPEIMQYAFEKKIQLTALTGANFNSVSEKMLECLVKYRFKTLRISIDGATNPTYQTFRKGGDLDNVIRNIERVNHYKKLHHSNFPIMIWIFILFDHNLHEVPLARETAKKLDMLFATSLNFGVTMPPIKDKARARSESDHDIATMEDFKEKTGVEFWVENAPCYQFWERPQINWDGKLLGCCANRFGDFGNVFESSLDTCLRSEKFLYAKKMLLGLRKSRDDIPCTKCFVYQNRLWQPFSRKRIFHKTSDEMIRSFQNQHS